MIYRHTDPHANLFDTDGLADDYDSNVLAYLEHAARTTMDNNDNGKQFKD